MENCASEVSEPHTSQSPFSTPASFIYNKYGTSTCKYLQKWGDLIKSDSCLGWLEWISFDTSKLNFLHAPLEKAGSKMELNEWDTYLDWKIEASKINTDKLSSPQGINETLLETVSELKKASKIAQCRTHHFLSPAVPLLHVFPFQDLPSLLLSPLLYTSYTPALN